MADRPANENRPAERAAPCAVCGKPANERFRPFCSKRCADVDLQRWLVGAYVIPGDEPAPGQDDGHED